MDLPKNQKTKMSIALGMEVVSDDDTSMFEYSDTDTIKPSWLRNRFGTSYEINASDSDTAALIPSLTSSYDLKKRSKQPQKHIVDLPCKVIIIGDSGAGKTSYVQRYVAHVYHSRRAWTAGVDFALKLVKWSENVNIKLQLWDIAGQERFASMTRVYYKDAHACIVMFDLSNRQSFLNAHKWKQDLDSKCLLPNGSPIPCVLLGNKCDLSHREVEHTEIEKFCKDHEFIGWTEISVKNDLMVDESMKFLLEDMMSRYGNLENSNETQSPELVQLSQMNTDSKKKKCSC